jgi:LPXTG-motif cell wall-anchored protein
MLHVATQRLANPHTGMSKQAELGLLGFAALLLLVLVFGRLGFTIVCGLIGARLIGVTVWRTFS